MVTSNLSRSDLVRKILSLLYGVLRIYINDHAPPNTDSILQLVDWHVITTEYRRVPCIHM